MRVHRHWTIIGIVLALLGSPSLLQASGFRLFDQSASGIAQGNAVTAQADDPSAVYYNPAGMPQVYGVQLSLGTSLVGGTTAFRNAAGQTATGDLGGHIASPPPSTFYLTANLPDLGLTALGSLAVGFAIIPPFGISIRYPSNGPFATAVTSADFPLVDFKPTVAYKINDYLAVGLGLDIDTFLSFVGKGQAAAQFQGFPGTPFAGLPLEINGTDTAVGFNVGMLYTPFRQADGAPLANVGFVYRRSPTLHLQGQLLAQGTVVADAATTFHLPQAFTGALALWPVRDQDHAWKLEVDLDYTDWSVFHNTDVRLSNGVTLPFPRQWHGGLTLMLGTEYTWRRPAWLPHWEVAVRTGYAFSQNVVPDATFSPSVPDADNHALAVGVGVVCKEGARFLGVWPCGRHAGRGLWPKAVGLDVTFQTLFSEQRTVRGNLNPTVDGTYKSTYYVGAVNLRMHF
jgi:long-chain fatty acid transport protein